MKKLQRGAGIVIPVSALPSRYGIGDFASAVQWLPWLQSAGLRYWQILPLTIPDSVGSPFASPSGEAMNPWLMSPDWLVEAGLITAAEARQARQPIGRIHRSDVSPAKLHLLKLAWERWIETATAAEHQALAKWRQANTEWLESYAHYQAIKDSYGGQPWWAWSPKLRDGRRAEKYLTPELRQAAEWHNWCQWLLSEQWLRVRRRARELNVTIIGDLPFYVQYDSVEVWARPDMFLLDRQRKMRVVSGAWPDLFSHHGQKWGTPLYRWRTHRRDRWKWWIGRIEAGLKLYDFIRFDHFAGLQATWHVPITAKDGTIGHWSQTPGREILQGIQRQVGRLPFIAEDLGRMSKNIIQLRHQFAIPGSRVLQFAWSGLPDNMHEPKNVTADMVLYTANHDTNTTLGWFRDEARPHEKKRLRATYGTVKNLSWKFIATVMEHRAVVAMVHISDVLSLGTEGRINHPGTKDGNWSWRMTRWPARSFARRLRRLAVAARRHPPRRSSV